MKVTHDLIAAVTGPGWKYGLSRLLINESGEGVVFIAGSNVPLAHFSAVDVRPNRGRGESAEGDITWRRRGSSCQYKLAKCKVSTATMTQWWENSLADSVEVAGDATVEMEPVPAGDVPEGAAHEIMDWVGDDVAKARAALSVESAKTKPRVGLSRDLAAMLDAEDLL